ncbi:MAG TPA: hypothetical protein ENH46_05100, partial [Candidatus Pacearchaeota archaeon]|nr:hypothetical protein [Candidatus Pacearchaeota archaeon]
MDRLLAPNENIAKCVGLWLAEGDNKTKSEITFTNNCWDLVNLFYRTINKIFYKHNYNPRIYVYSKDKKKVKIHYKNCVVKYYVHKKAIKPFFILRFASVEMVKEWKKIVKFFLDKKEFFPNILKGFFAGEGNVHVGRKSVRVLRVSQKERKKFIDDLLNSLNISFSFETGNRNYVIT